MLAIRREQMEVFHDAERKNFEDWMIDHVNRFFPKQSRLLSQGEMRETIRHGIRRAAAYGITSQRDVCKYIDLLVVFGRDLDTDGQYPWAGDTLRQPLESEARVTALQQAAVEHLGKESSDAGR
jgi:hypothetical protein